MSAEQHIVTVLQNIYSKEEITKVEIQPEVNGTRVVIHSGSPARVIGRKGVGVRLLRHILQKEFGIVEPHISVANIHKEGKN